jgi:anti-sigma B factor antagonist
MPTLISAPPTPDINVKTPLLRIAATIGPSGALLRCAGEIDVSNVDQLEAALTALVQSGLPEVRVDLRGVDYLDAAAIKALMRAYYTLMRSGRRLSVCIEPRTLRLFLLLKLDRVLDVHCA